MWYKNIRAQNFLILAFSLVGFMGSVYVFNLQWKLSPGEKQQIQAAVVSSLVDYFTFHPKVETDYLFIGHSGSDPSSEILKPFENHVPAVEPISSSRISFGFSAPVVHASNSRKRGIQIDLENPERKSNGDVRVRISIYQDKAASATYLFRLNKRNGEYRVASVTFPDRPVF